MTSSAQDEDMTNGTSSSLNEDDGLPTRRRRSGRDTRFQPRMSGNLGGRKKKEPNPYFDDPGQAHAMETISGRDPKGEKISLRRVDAVRLAMFNKAAKGDVAAARFWHEMNGGVDLLRFTLSDVRKTKREAQRFHELLEEEIAAEAQSKKGSTDALDPTQDQPPSTTSAEQHHEQVHAPQSTANRRAITFTTAPKRDYRDLSGEEKALENAVVNAIWAASEAEGRLLENLLPSRRLTFKIDANFVPRNLKDENADSANVDEDTAKSDRSDSVHDAPSVNSNGERAENNSAAEPESEQSQDDKDYERYLSLSELEKDQLDNLELVERFEGPARQDDPDSPKDMRQGPYPVEIDQDRGAASEQNSSPISATATENE